MTKVDSSTYSCIDRNIYHNTKLAKSWSSNGLYLNNRRLAPPCCAIWLSLCSCWSKSAEADVPTLEVKMTWSSWNDLLAKRLSGRPSVLRPWTDRPRRWWRKPGLRNTDDVDNYKSHTKSNIKTEHLAVTLSFKVNIQKVYLHSTIFWKPRRSLQN